MSSTSSAFVLSLEEKLLLTNRHCVAHASCIAARWWKIIGRPRRIIGFLTTIRGFAAGIIKSPLNRLLKS